MIITMTTLILIEKNPLKLKDRGNQVRSLQPTDSLVAETCGAIYV